MNSFLKLPDNSFVRKLSINDIGQIYHLQERITKNLSNGFVHSKSKEELSDFINGNKGITIGIEANGKVVAFSILQVPNISNPNTNLKFKNIPDEDWGLATCFIENTIVQEKFQGKGLQKLLVDLRISVAINYNMKWICSGVNFENNVSWMNLIKKGLFIVDYREDRGYLTLGLSQKINQEPLAFSKNNELKVKTTDKNAHINAIDNGFIGVKLIKEENDKFVIYNKLTVANNSYK